MGKAGGISGKGAIRKFERYGYAVVRQRGSHVRLQHHDSTRHLPLTIPLHKELKIGLLRQLMKDADIELDLFLSL